MKVLIGRFSRFVRRIGHYLCTIDNANGAEGLAECLASSRHIRTEEEKIKHHLLKNVPDDKKDEVFARFQRLNLEIDPLQDVAEIQPDSVGSINANIPTVDKRV